jgi:hypothetical protein
VLLIMLAGLIVLAALGWLSVALWRTWKRVLATGRSIGAAADRLTDASAGLQGTADVGDRGGTD